MIFRRRRFATALLGAVVTLAAAACTSNPAVVPGPEPAPAVAAFAAAWQGLKADPIAALTDDPGSARQEVGSVLENLAPGRLGVTATNVRKTGDLTATATADFAWTLADGISWKYTANWTFSRAAPSDDWKATWAATMINPRLGEAQSVQLKTVPATSGSILDRDQLQILSPTKIYSVVALPDKVGNASTTAAALARILGPLDPTVTAASVRAGLAAATAATGYTVTNLREAEYQQVRSELNTVTGLSVPTSTRNLPASKDFARELLSEVQPVAKKLMQGTAGWEIDAVDATGAELETLASQPAKPGVNVTLTLDTAVQKAAEAALVGYEQPTVLVAIQPSTGEILAVAQNQPANAQGPIALTGRYPPGSTFKIVTATAAFEQSLVTPTTDVDCPGVITVDSREIHNNASFELGTVSVTRAFAKSCNTTFAHLATEMPADALTNAGYQYGIGRDFVVPGITTLTGKVPAADSAVQKAENGFGQGVVLVTPFGQALMDATAANGAMPLPTLIRGAATTVDQPVVARSAQTTSSIRTLMRSVVTAGTATALQDAGEVYAKTGTADFIDTDGVDRAHAWTIGYRGDLAFSVLIVAGGTSGKTTTIADKFLRAVPAG